MIDQPYDLAALAEKAEAAMRDFDTEKERVSELQQQWADGGGDETVRAKDRSLSMTFNARGELVGMKFHGDKFRSMAAAELAHVIVETARSGRTLFLEKLDTQMGDAFPGLKMSELVSGKTDVNKVMESLFGFDPENVGSIFGDEGPKRADKPEKG